MSIWKCALTKESQMHISINSSDVAESIENVSLRVQHKKQATPEVKDEQRRDLKEGK